MASKKSRKSGPTHPAAVATSSSVPSRATPGGLQSVVSSLTRAAAGGIPSDIPDEELDRYIAQKIVEEAAAANKRYSEIGLGAYLSRNKLPKPNTRFLANVIRSTDAHNDALLRKERQEAEQRWESLHRERSRSPPHHPRKTSSRHEEDRSMNSRRSAREDSRESDQACSASTKKTAADNVEDEGRTRKDRSSTTRKKRRERRSRSRSPLESPHASSFLKGAAKSEKKPSTDTGIPTLQKVVVKRGRGDVGSSRLDKFFDEKYDPGLDIDNYDDNSLSHYVSRLEGLAADRGMTLDQLYANPSSSSKKKKSKKDIPESDGRAKRKKDKEKKSSNSRSDRKPTTSPEPMLDSPVRGLKRVYGAAKPPRNTSPSPDRRSQLPAACPW
ncbi:hypothetical protein DFS34DRAFT_615374 [Phlyctochytrium arcticum]|nr:hypothetical protein DFS34DRAFT_615374 [Phlyctochytrium arcticum]